MLHCAQQTCVVPVSTCGVFSFKQRKKLTLVDVFGDLNFEIEGIQ